MVIASEFSDALLCWYDDCLYMLLHVTYCNGVLWLCACCIRTLAHPCLFMRLTGLLKCL